MFLGLFLIAVTLAPPAPPIAGRGESAAKSLAVEIDDLKHRLEGTLADLKASQKQLTDTLDRVKRLALQPCQRFDTKIDERRETVVLVGGRLLRFVEIAPPGGEVELGLTEERTTEWFRKVQNTIPEPMLPKLFLSVGEVHRTVAPFLIQDRLIDPPLYSELTGGKDPTRISLKEAYAFLRELNSRCKNAVQFTLPTEEQWLAAAREAYNPEMEGLRSCEDLRKAGKTQLVQQLFGRSWQLTLSPCVPFARDEGGSCDESSLIRKGGTASSPHALECLPEYRSAIPADVSAPESSFRLVLLEATAPSR